MSFSPVDWGCKIYRLHLGRMVRSPSTRYDIKQSNGEAPVMLDIWRMPSTLSLPLLPGSLGFRLVPPDRVLFMGQIELFDI